MSIQYRISPEVFDRFPDYRRGVVIAEGLRNPPSPPGLEAELRAAEASIPAQLTAETLTSHPNIAAWREAYRAVGIKPADFRPSVEGLARRALRGDPLPLINTLVDLGNLASLRHLLPIGAHAIDVVSADLSLRPADGSETFEPFGSDALEHPLPGEIIFAEGSTVLTRRWTWRQAKHTLVVPETSAVEINVDALPPLGQAEVERICAELAGLVQRYCGGSARWEILSRDHPVLVLK